MTRDHATVVFNGEIYNYVELRSELVTLGHRFESTTDTEVLLAAYLEWGTDAVKRFDGMWAFAIHDTQRNLLFLSRDRFGEKPLMYAQPPGGFVFASEPRQLRAVGLQGEPDELSLREMIAFGAKVDDESTYFSGISNVRPATNVLVDCSTLEMRQETYHRVGESGLFTGITAGDVPAVFAEEFRRSIKARLRSDVQVGMLLSGGVDSSLIASVAGPAYQAVTGRRMLAFTASSGDPKNDESHWAEVVAADTSLGWEPVQVSKRFGQKEWAAATRVVEQPLASSSIVMQLDVMRRAKQAGVTVLLDGQGADESWLGYPRYAVSALSEFPASERLKFMRQSADRTGLGLPRWIAYFAYFKNPSVAAMRSGRRFRRAKIDLDRGWYKETCTELLGMRSKSIIDVQRSQLQGEKLSSLLRYADRTSMHFSLEDRTPFLDHRLVELSLAVPIDVKFHQGWTKWTLRRQLAETVDPSVAWRKAKIGFEPASASFDVDSRAVHQMIRSSCFLEGLGSVGWDLGKADKSTLWRLFAVALWEAECFA